ncbi:MAG TPA: carboxypeptidase regulatory-like domain-containing protein, partial [Candidatus Acidoferrum sp.]|nr:carboxypeptidase regulatory-like domain-containing protein [Candidatus Acidoferrum sp.]
TPAVVTGVVKLDGPLPAVKPISMAKEPECMKMHPGGATTEEAITGSGGTLGNVIVYVSEGLGSRTFDPPADPVVIEQKGCTYRPHVLTMQANQKIQIVNSDPTSHNIHPLPTNNREWNKSQPPGQPPIEATFAREEIAIPVKCNEHPWMHAYIAVFKHPFFIVTGKDGRFELKNLPPGEYTLSAWHEKFGTVEQKIAVGPKETKTVEFVIKARKSVGAAGAQ